MPTGEEVRALPVFALIAESTVAVPVIGYLIAGDCTEPALAKAKDWLIQNNTAVMAIQLLVFGVSLIGDAIAILFRPSGFEQPEPAADGPGPSGSGSIPSHAGLHSGCGGPARRHAIELSSASIIAPSFGFAP